jgi:hypothetical protein
MREQTMARRRQLNIVAAAGKQTRAQPVFKLSYSRAHGSLSQEQVASRTSEMARPVDLEESPKRFCVHVLSRSNILIMSANRICFICWNTGGIPRLSLTDEAAPKSSALAAQQK